MTNQPETPVGDIDLESLRARFLALAEGPPPQGTWIITHEEAVAAAAALERLPLLEREHRALKALLASHCSGSVNGEPDWIDCSIDDKEMRELVEAFSLLDTQQETHG